MCPLEFRDALQRLNGVVLRRRPIQVSVAHRSEQHSIERCPLLVPNSAIMPKYGMPNEWQQQCSYLGYGWNSLCTQDVSTRSPFSLYFFSQASTQLNIFC